MRASNVGAGALARTDSEEAIRAVESCPNGDPMAQRRFYELSHQNVYGLMVRMVGMQEAADVTQQVFLQMFRKIGQFTGRSRIGTWIYRVAVNEALQFDRRSKWS